MAEQVLKLVIAAKLGVKRLGRQLVTELGQAKLGLQEVLAPGQVKVDCYLEVGLVVERSVGQRLVVRSEEEKQHVD